MHTDAVRAAVMCLRLTDAAELTTYESLSEARAAAALQCPDSRCRREHVIAWTENGAVATEFVNTKPPPSLRSELRKLYPPMLRETTLAPQFWPMPSILNTALGPRRPPTP